MGDFWQMIWEQQSTIIVMLTKEEENGRIKCHCYWPDTETCIKQFDNLQGITVELISEIDNGVCTLRTIKLTCQETSIKVYQYHFTDWPDHSSSDLQLVLSLRDLVNIQYRSTRNPPPLVLHCSAGVGRTGTYAVIDSVLDALDSDDNFYTSQENVIDSHFLALRQQRVYTVQTLDQYLFCYDAILNRVVKCLD